MWGVRGVWGEAGAVEAEAEDGAGEWRETETLSLSIFLPYQLPLGALSFFPVRDWGSQVWNRGVTALSNM